jgi:hypothetical protein
MSNVEKFLNELDLLSRKHGVWIEIRDTDEANLVDENFDELTTTFYCDEDTQEYKGE